MREVLRMATAARRKKPDLVGRIEKDECNGCELPVVIYEKWCKGCGICAEFCPGGVIEIDPHTQKAKVVNPEKCNLCGTCELRCPDFAITRVQKKGSKNGGRKES